MSWASFIRNDIRTKISKKSEIPENLTLHSLSKQYNVSTTPVRIAVNELLEEKFLVRLTNGRLAINPRKIGRPLKSSNSQPPELPRDYRAEITRDLIIKSVSGSPEFIREEQTAKQYGISSPVVRELLHQLAGQGVLRHHPRRGWELRLFRQRDFKDYLCAREALELTALEQSWDYLENSVLDKINAGNQLPKTKRQRPIIDDSIHKYIVEKADNFYISDFFQRHGTYFDVLTDWDSQNRASAIEAIEQHHEIIAVILKRDIRTTRKLLSNHIRTNYALLNQLHTHLP